MAATPDWLEAQLEPQPEDSSDLRWALETAVALFVRGDRPQALRWLQHAVATAKTDGRLERANDLDRAATELEQRPFPRKRSSPNLPAQNQKGTQLIPAMPPMDPTAPSPPPAQLQATMRTPTQQQPQLQAPAQSARQTVRTAPYKIQPDELTHMGGPDSELLAACEASAPTPNLAMGEAPITPPPPARPRPPTLIKEGLDATLTNVRRERPPPPSINREQGEHTQVMGLDELPQPSVSPRLELTAAPSTLGSPQNALESMRALRVVIESGIGKKLVVRRLDDGEQVPLGAQEALLVPLGIGKKPPIDPTQS